jgi:hypothetical protein
MSKLPFSFFPFSLSFPFLFFFSPLSPHLLIHSPSSPYPFTLTPYPSITFLLHGLTARTTRRRLRQPHPAVSIAASLQPNCASLFPAWWSARLRPATPPSAPALLLPAVSLLSPLPLSQWAPPRDGMEKGNGAGRSYSFVTPSGQNGSKERISHGSSCGADVESFVELGPSKEARRTYVELVSYGSQREKSTDVATGMCCDGKTSPRPETPRGPDDPTLHTLGLALSLALTLPQSPIHHRNLGVGGNLRPPTWIPSSAPPPRPPDCQPPRPSRLPGVAGFAAGWPHLACSHVGGLATVHPPPFRRGCGRGIHAHR